VGHQRPKEIKTRGESEQIRRKRKKEGEGRALCFLWGTFYKRRNFVKKRSGSMGSIRGMTGLDDQNTRSKSNGAKRARKECRQRRASRNETAVFTKKHVRDKTGFDGRWSTPRRIGGGGGGPMYRCGMHLGRNRGLGLLGHPEDVKKALFTVISNQGRRIQLDGGRAGGSREKPLDDRSDVNKANSGIKDKKPSERENDEN